MEYEQARSALGTTRFADLRSVVETGSTNADMRDLIGVEGPLEQPIVLLADHQNAGRGRLDRGWEAPPGSAVLMTIGLPVSDIPIQFRTLLTMALSMAATDATGTLGLDQVTLKWPNDLVVNDDGTTAASPAGYRKVGGILAESLTVGGSDHAIVGMGLNVNWVDLPEHLVDSATSLAILTGAEIDRDRFVGDLLGRLDTKWMPLLESAPSDLVEAYQQRCSTVGQTVRIELAGESITGVATGVTESGALIVDVDGTSHTVTAGDVTHLRPVV